MADNNIPEDVRKAIGERKLEEVVIEVTYKNWQGQVSRRKIIPLSTQYGKTEYHPSEQWLMRVWDVDKKDYRTYALKDIQEWHFNP